MDLNLSIIVILVLSGIAVGFINTLAGGGTVISLTIFMALGMPVQVANGTNRISIIMQDFTSTATFMKKRMVDWRSALKLCIPSVIGAVIGSQIAVTIDPRIFHICLGIVLVGVLIFTLIGDKLVKRRGVSVITIKPIHYFIFFLIGLYTGYVFVGMGYMVLLVTMGMMHLNIVAANVVKAMILFVVMPFSLLVFIIHGDVNYIVGLIHGMGNVIGAFLASHYAIGWGTKFLKWFMVVVVLFCLADLTGLISIRDWVLAILK